MLFCTYLIMLLILLHIISSYPASSHHMPRHARSPAIVHAFYLRYAPLKLLFCESKVAGACLEHSVGIVEACHDRCKPAGVCECEHQRRSEACNGCDYEVQCRSRLSVGMRLEEEMMLTPQDEQLRRELGEKSFMAAAAQVRAVATQSLAHS